MSEKAENNSQMILLTGLWLKTSKKGKKYFSGNMGQNRLLIYKNENKTKDTQPDYLLYIAPPMPKDAKDAIAKDDFADNDPFADLK